jgi:sugar fermentation stimulation protein A
MRFEPPLERGVLERRYKRFLADVRLDDQRTLTVHCANTGAMTGCSDPGLEVWFGASSNPRRKYRHTLEVVCAPHGRVGVNTARANALVGEALAERRLAALAGYAHVRREIPGRNGETRFDFCLEGTAGRCWVEVKSMTLCDEHGCGAFPDAVSTRARRHVEALAEHRREGDRAVLLFCAQHSGIRSATVADGVDPDYGAAVRAAVREGVEVLAYGCRIERDFIRLEAPLPVLL